MRGETMTIQGTVNKTGLLLILLLLAAAHTWNMFFTSGNPAGVMPWMWGGMIGGFVVALITVFKKHWAMLTAPSYALLEGLFLGALSSILEAQYPGNRRPGRGVDVRHPFRHFFSPTVRV